ncbi:Alpha/Beta hydrolase protein, partial [Mycena rebaudengoi]
MHWAILQIGLFVIVFAGTAVAAPHSTSNPSIKTISTSQVASYRPYTHFASAAYCSSNMTRWSCGADCSANADFRVVATGGDGLLIQYWFVGYSPSLKTVIVSHQGTNPTSIFSFLTDAEFFRTSLSPILFPGINLDIGVHLGFVEAHARTASDVLAAVTKALTWYNADHITLVGHSLASGALSLLDSVYLPLHLASSVKFNTVVYGMPRVGNQAFADYVDAKLSLTRINNQKDIPRDGGFHHPAGEIHQTNGTWYSCPGQENSSDLCAVGAVPNVLLGSIVYHDGPYDGVLISCK